VTGRQQVDALARDWSEHCRRVWYGSNLADYLNHPAYRQLAGLGHDALPRIMELYEVDDLPWEFVLEAIAGIRLIEDRSTDSTTEIKKRWLEWWAREVRNRAATALERKPAPFA
jgi:hypothetical protein